MLPAGLMDHHAAFALTSLPLLWSLKVARRQDRKQKKNYRVLTDHFLKVLPNLLCNTSPGVIAEDPMQMSLQRQDRSEN